MDAHYAALLTFICCMSLLYAAIHLFLHRMKKKLKGDSKMTLAELQEWMKKHSVRDLRLSFYEGKYAMCAIVEKEEKDWVQEAVFVSKAESVQGALEELVATLDSEIGSDHADHP